jgi:hypothetical protein
MVPFFRAWFGVKNSVSEVGHFLSATPDHFLSLAAVEFVGRTLASRRDFAKTEHPMRDGDAVETSGILFGFHVGDH